MKSNITHTELNIDEIILLEENPRDISDSDLQKLADEIKEDPSFLIQRPPLINFTDGKHYCYAGTQRIKAARLNGQKSILCFIEKDVSKKVQQKRMVIDNLHRGTWNEGKLLELDFDIDELQDFGFKDFEVSIFHTGEEEPYDLIAPMKEAPPTMKITFTDGKQMDRFQDLLKELIDKNEVLTGLSYSISQGEI